jgi:hypothetical protein
VDELLAMMDTLRRSMPGLRRCGHQVHVWQVGLENFSAVENLRFNKGVAPDEIARLMPALQALERDFPSEFVFSPHGFAMIVFTPWTTLEDIETNVRELRRWNIRAADISSRLQLRAGTPLELLAGRDGLLAPRGPVDPFQTPCISHAGEEEIPWTFAHAEVATVYACLQRLLNDTDAARVQARRRRLASVLQALVELVRGDLAAPPDAVLQRYLDPSTRTDAAGRLGTLRRLLSRVCDGYGKRMPGLTSAAVEGADGEDMELSLIVDGVRYELELAKYSPDRPCFLRTPSFAVTYSRTTPPASQRHVRTMAVLVHLFDAAVRKTTDAATAPTLPSSAPKRA